MGGGTKRQAEAAAVSPSKKNERAKQRDEVTIAPESEAGSDSELEYDEEIVPARCSDESDVEMAAEEVPVRRPYRPGIDKLGDDEVLEMDPSAYDMYHKFTTEWPCLSFDFICPEGVVAPADSVQNLASAKTVFLVAGTQAAPPAKNAVTLYRCGNLHRTWEPSDQEESDDGEEEPTETLTLDTSHIEVTNAINRVAVCPKLQQLVAATTDTGEVMVFNVQDHVERLNDPKKFADPCQKPMYYNSACHATEGFGLEWSPIDGTFATGGRDRRICIHAGVSGGWQLQATLTGHTGSVEGLSFQHNSSTVLASASADRSVRIWDLRTNSCPIVIPNLHDGDVNVVRFCPTENQCNQILTGGDDGVIKIIDVRQPDMPLFDMKYHSDAICSLEWNRLDYTSFVAGSYDNRATIWDLSAEGEEVVNGIPPQFIFEHCGHTELSTVKYHPNIPYLCVSTGSDAFNIWRSEDLYRFVKEAHTSFAS